MFYGTKNKGKGNAVEQTENVPARGKIYVLRHK